MPVQSVRAAVLDCVVGALDATSDTTGVTFHRSPAIGRARLADMFYDFASGVPSGVRIEMRTDATALELDVDVTRIVLPDLVPSPTVFDLVLDGVLSEPVEVDAENLIVVNPTNGEVDMQQGGPATVRFDLGAAAVERRVEIWFPNAPTLRLLDARVSDGSALHPAPASGPVWVHHGSSISQCSEADRPTSTWPAIVARTAGRSLVNLGLAGQCQMDQFIARAIRDLPADGISLELGINIHNADSMRERTFIPALHGFLDTIRDGHPETPIVVITPIIYPAGEQQPGPVVIRPGGQFASLERPPELATGALTVGRIRELLHRHVEARRAEGDVNLHIVDGLQLFGEGDVADLPDGLHPNTAGYRRMAERFLALAFAEHGPLRSPEIRSPR
jgi:GDSL-like Lipase/Acylhydrolase family